MKEIKDRVSTRAYLDKAVSDEDVYSLIDSARLAPSGSNTQPWRFIVVKDQKMKESIAKIDNNQQWMIDAPVFIVALAEGSARAKDESVYFDENSSDFELKQLIRDTSISIDHLILQAEHLGISTCWTAWFEQKPIKDLMSLPSNTFVVGVITVGYSKNDKINHTKRKPIEEIMFFEEYKI